MAVQRAPGGTSLIDVLDTGIVIDACVRVSLLGIDPITVEARIVVASTDTYLKYAESVGVTAPASKAALQPIRVMPAEEVDMRQAAELRDTSYVAPDSKIPRAPERPTARHLEGQLTGPGVDLRSNRIPAETVLWHRDAAATD